jgi:hypothetical protein
MKKKALCIGLPPLLIAPLVQAPIPTQRLILTLGKNTDSKKVEDDLKKLVRYPVA